MLLFGPPGGGKSHLAAAIGLALIENGWRVLFTRTTDLVQKLQLARRELNLEAAINRLDRFDLLILDDLAYVTKDQAETSVLFELISARYERRSMLITANQPFGEWNKVFPDPAMTLAAIDRLVHHATIVEMNVESYRRRTALERKRGPGRPPSHATIKTVADCRSATIRLQQNSCARQSARRSSTRRDTDSSSRLPRLPTQIDALHASLLTIVSSAIPRAPSGGVR
ncbi:NAD(P)-dependent dehydrogenase (short-subunit alcohol dehydrogenase family) [Bradyrhizobium sp. GM6.1]